MPQPASNPNRVQFGVFELDLQRAELRKQGVRVKLQEQPLKVLQILLENPGQIVAREELQERVWPANTFVEFDQGLYSAMARLRDALGDSWESPRFIETVARRGYRFIAPVTPITAIPEGNITPEHEIDAKMLSLQRLLLNVLAGLLGGALLLAIVLEFDIAGAREWLRSRTTPIRSIAVLPLVNLSGDPQQEYFADGMTDELITDLAQLPGVRVISRTSVLPFRKSTKTLPEIAKELNVDAVVEGTVERSGNHVRFRVQLVRGIDDRHLWAQAFDRDLSDVLLVESDAAREIANQVGVNLVQSASRNRRNHFMTAEAYDSYLRGRYYSRTGKREDLERATTYFQQAIMLDPRAGLAYCGLADVYMFESYFGRARKESAAKARFAAMKALELSPDLADSHLAMTGIAELEWNWAEAEKHYKRALELEPGLAQGHLGYGMFLAASGRFAQALPEIQMALQLDPLSPDTRASAGFSYYLGGDMDHAIEQSKKALEIDPTFEDAHANLLYSYMQKGMYDQAVQEFRPFGALLGYPEESVTAIQQAYRKNGIAGFWQTYLDLNQRGRIPALESFDLAAVYTALGQNSKALDCLEKALAEREPKLGSISVLPELRSLHTEPRFAALVQRVGPPSPEVTR